MIPRRIHRNSCGSAAASDGERGYVLVVFILFTALLMVGLLKIIPKAAFEGRRDKEEELIFRGLQYQRAIQLFVRKMGRYPNSVEQLQKTNGFRFLRKAYKDPMTKEGAWRLIHIGPNGAMVDAQTSLPLPPGTSASGSNAGQTGASGSQPSSGTNPSGLGAPGTTGQPATGTGSSFGGGYSGGGTAQPGGIAAAGGPQPDASSPSANSGPNPFQVRSTAQNQPATDGSSSAGGSPSTAGATPSSGNASSTITSSLQTTSSPVLGGAPIAGVASTRADESIKVWNTFSEYDKWEFVYDFRRDPLAVAAMTRSGAIPQQQQTQPQSNPQPTPSPVPGAPPFGAPGPGGRLPGSPGFTPPPLPGGFPTPQQR